MSFLKSIKGWFVEPDPVLQLSAGSNNVQDFIKDVKKKKRHSITRALKRRNYRIEPDMRKFKYAMDYAEDERVQDREVLYQLYHRIMEHPVVFTQIRNARAFVQMSDFEIRVNKKHDEKLTELFDKPWFFKFLQYCVDSEMFGHSLIELQSGDDDFINKAFLVPREHVKPEQQLIVPLLGSRKGFSYIEKPFADKVVPIGDENDLGLLAVLFKSALRSEYSNVDWGRRNERYGEPIAAMQTDTSNKDNLDERQRMMENLGGNGWLIYDHDDNFMIKEPLGNTGGGHKTFDDYIDRNDKYIALLVNGQTTTTEQTAYVGSSEVQERVQNKITLARLRRIQYAINYSLVPFLTKYKNYPLSNADFTFLDLEKKESEPMKKKEVEPNNPDDDPK